MSPHLGGVGHVGFFGADPVDLASASALVLHFIVCTISCEPVVVDSYQIFMDIYN